MATAATLFTQDNLNYFMGYMRVRTLDLMMEAKDGFELFWMNEREIYGSKFEEQRVAIKTLVEMNGDIIEMPSNGLPTGQEDWEEGDSYEEKIELKEYYGRAFIKEANISKLNARLTLLNLQTKEGQDEADRIMVEMGFDSLLRNEMYRGMMNKKKAALMALFDGFKTKQINGVDFVVANSGTLLTGDNLGTGSFGPDIQDQIISLNRGMKTLKGYKTGYTTPEYLFTSEVNYTSALEVFQPWNTVNVDHRNIMGFFQNGGKTYLEGVDWTSAENKTIAIGGAHGIHVLEETAEPRIVMAYDNAGNLCLYMKSIWGVGVNTRANIVEIDHT